MGHQELPEGLRVKYRHERIVAEDQMTILPRGGYTIANILDAEDKIVATGRARCSMSDNYSKAAGRSISTTRALADLFNTREMRRQKKREEAQRQAELLAATQRESPYTIPPGLLD